MKNAFWAKDWFAGLVIIIAVAILSFGDTFNRIELSAYDMGVRASAREAGDQIAVIGIDDESIANLGRWPWPRDIHATMVDRLKQAGAKVVGFTVLLSEPQQDAGLTHIREMHRFFNESGLNDPALVAGPLAAPVGELGVRLGNAEVALDTDSKLAGSFRSAGNIVLGMQMTPGRPNGNPDAPVAEWLMRNALPDDNVELSASVGNEIPEPIATTAIAPPIEKLAVPSRSVGHLVTLLEDDGKVRTEPLMLEYFGVLFPSMSLQLAAASLNLTVKDIRVVLGEGVQLGNLSIMTDPKLNMRSFYYGGTEQDAAFAVDSFYDVYSGKLDINKYKGKVVLIGPTAFGLGSALTTPLPGALEPVQVLAHNVASILNEDFFVVPVWAPFVKWLAVLLVGAYLVFMMPRLGAGKAAAVSALLLITFFGTEMFLLAGSGAWVPLMLPVLMVLIGHLALTTRHFLITERGKRRSDTESAESNRMLGLAFQQAGQLDMAFEKFRRVPLGDDMMDPLYNLALDLERKRQFSKAAAVYQYMSEHNKDFRDIAPRMQRASAAQDSMIFGLRSGGAGDTLMTGALGAEKPMLGRYEIDKELGRGAMGVVYRGTDPRINRTVAIKTMALAQEFEESELAEVKERFFREAEAAGRLNHPNVVTIYDTGEEHDLAWIAMELLTGHDLVRYTRPDNLLPIQKVISIVARAAEGLDYAHANNVVHRDIKPANIMYDPETDAVKIADFGIARVSNSGKTKTGMVVGTPSFMSPEQVTGRKDLDGRTDIFSLGVVLYQLVTLELPWDGEQATQIMYKIATEPYPDPLEIRPDLKKTCPWVSIVIKRALEKDRDKRYQTGAQMAKDLRACLAKMAELQKKQATGGTGPAPAVQ
jgi:CHASE2 domain-containing sensor protein/tRNA A-37 threonylcarbamoyl transferase component Bud32